MPSTLVALRMASQRISEARIAAVVSVVRKGEPRPPAKRATPSRDSARWASRWVKVSATVGIGRPEKTDASMPRARSASRIARAFITVAIMPMWSPVTRSVPCFCSQAPRNRLPPPMTMPISAPSARAATMSSAMRPTTAGSMPSGAPPASASPDSFSSTRFQVRVIAVSSAASAGASRSPSLERRYTKGAGSSPAPWSQCGGAGEAGAEPDQTPAAAATSAAKSEVSFSMPSPITMRTKALMATGAPRSLEAWATSASMVSSGFITKFCLRRVTSS